jgi:antitoxin HigA-1
MVEHPGLFLDRELRRFGVSPTQLARQLMVPPNRVSQIINGKRAITGDSALRLAHWFGNSPSFWMNLQTQFDLWIAAEALGRRIKTLPTHQNVLTARVTPTFASQRKAAHGRS